MKDMSVFVFRCSQKDGKNKKIKDFHFWNDSEKDDLAHILWWLGQSKLEFTVSKTVVSIIL